MEAHEERGGNYRESGLQMTEALTRSLRLNTKMTTEIVKDNISIKWIVLYILLFIPLVKPDAISQWDSLKQLETIYRIWKYATIVGVVILFVFEYKTARISLFPVLISIAVLMLGLSTALHHQNVMLTVFNHWIGVIAATLIIEEAVGRRPRELLIAILVVLSSLLIINAYFVVISPPIALDQESSLHVFLGQKNSVRNYVLPAMCIAFSLPSLGVLGAKTFGIAISVVGIVSQVLFYSATGVVVTVLLLICCLFPAIPKMITKAIGLIIPAVLNYIIVFIKVPILSDVIETLLHKDVSFTGRNKIWEVSIQKINNSPIFGNGSGDAGLARAVSEAANSSHNALLDITYQGGIVALIPFVILYLMSYHNLYKAPSSTAKYIIIATLLLFLISGIFENLSYVGFFFVLQLAYHAVIFSNSIEGEYADQHFS